MPFDIDQISDDELVACLAGLRMANATEKALASFGAIQGLKRRYWRSVWDAASGVFAYYFRCDASLRINVNDFTESIFHWLVNEGAVKYMQYREKPETERGGFEGWLKKTTRNKAVERLRELRARLVPLDEPVQDGGRPLAETIAGPDLGPFAPSQEEEEIARLNACIAELHRAATFRAAIRECLTELQQKNPTQHLVIILSLAAGMERGEIVEWLSRPERRCTAQDVANWQHRGLNLILECLEKKGMKRIQRSQQKEFKENLGGLVVMAFSEEPIVCGGWEQEKGDEP